MPAVCFVCLGNICRSPMARAIFEQLLVERGLREAWRVDSSGTGHWHIGKPADPRTREVLRRAGIPLEHRARQLRPADFHDFDWLLAMDHDNLAVLHASAPADCRADRRLIGDFDPAGEEEVPDPYYGGDDGFDRVFDMLSRSCAAFLDRHA